MNDSLGDRMKVYESISQNNLLPNCPAIIRVDGKAFHSYTKNMDRPFDYALHQAMVHAALCVIRNSHNIVCAYGQSDEVSFLLIDYKRPQSQQYFDGKIQKISSVTASMFTAFFNAWMMSCMDMAEPKATMSNPAMFDARTFSLPTVTEVENYFYWRYLDCVRNSISMAARSVFSHNQLQNANSEVMKEMLRQEGRSWEDMYDPFKNGWMVTSETDSYLNAIHPSNGKGDNYSTGIKMHILKIIQEYLKEKANG